MILEKLGRPRREMVESYSVEATSLRAKRRSNPLSPRMRKDGLLRCARNDGSFAEAASLFKLGTTRNKSLLQVSGDSAFDCWL